MIKKLKNIDKYYFLIFGISIFVFLPFVSKFYFWGHDTHYHVSNILALDHVFRLYNLFQLKIFPIIARDFGYGSGIFYPQLSHFVAVIFYKLLSPFHLNVTYALKLTHFSAMFLSGIFMYLLLQNICKNKKISFVGSCFYMTMPYHIIDTIIRDAFAEIFVFTFLPLVFLGIVYLFQGKYRGFYISFVFGYIGLFFSHLVLTVYVTIFLGIVLLLNFKKVFKKKIFFRLVLATFIVILSVLCLLVPLLEHRFLGNYAVFSDNFMASVPILTRHSLNIFELFLWQQRSDTHLLFYINIVPFLLALYGIYKRNFYKENDWLFRGAVLIAVLCIIMMSIFFPWSKMPSFLQMIQFPWRLEIFFIFSLCILAVFALMTFSKELRPVLVCVSILSCLFYTVQVLSLQNYSKIDLNEINFSSSGTGGGEYFPVNVINNFDYYENRSNDILVTSGIADISILENNTPDLTFKVNALSDVTLELPRIYYLGYQVVATYEDGSSELLSYVENTNGFIEVNLHRSAQVQVTYSGTVLDKLSNVISFIVMVLFSLIMIGYKKIKLFKK